MSRMKPAIYMAVICSLLFEVTMLGCSVYIRLQKQVLFVFSLLSQMTMKSCGG